MSEIRVTCSVSSSFEAMGNQTQLTVEDTVVTFDDDSVCDDNDDYLHDSKINSDGNTLSQGDFCIAINNANNGNDIFNLIADNLPRGKIYTYFFIYLIDF